MLQYYRENIFIYILLAIWGLSGMYGGPLVYGIIPLCLILMRRKGMDEEIFFGYLFILVLSDSKEHSLEFAKNFKNIYIIIISAFVFLNINSFRPLNHLYKLFIPFFLISIVSMSFSISDAFFFTSFQKTLSFFLSFLVVPNFVTKLFREEGTQFLKRFIMFCFTILCIGFVLEVVAPDSALLLGSRFRGIFGGPNGLGVFCVLFFIITYVVNDFFPDLLSKNERLMIFGIIMIAIFMTGSRNAIISVTIFYVFQRFFSLSPFLGFILFLITGMVAEVVSSNATTIITSMGLGEYFRTQTLEEGSGRYIAWGFAWQQIQHNFFIGKGFAYNEFYMRQHYGELLKLNHQGGIHNSFLTFWMDQGLIGLLIYLRSYILLFIKGAAKTRFAFPIMFAISFSAFFESWLVGSLSPFAFMGMFIFTLLTCEEIVPGEMQFEGESIDASPTPILN